nr:pectinesterase/pectinesterase inhibitor ppe8b [Quercus suber]
MQNSITVANFGTNDLKFDLQTWLSTAITNLATCIEELVCTNMSTILKESISISLEKVIALVSNRLAYVQQSLNDTISDSFQSWFTSHDWKLMQASEILVNSTVSSDGSSDYKTIMDAVKAAPSISSKRFVIYIKKGIYREYVSIPGDKWNIMMVGDGIDQTIISGDRSNATGWTTYNSATFAVLGRNFIAVNMTFKNTAGPKGGQAVTLLSQSDLSVFYRCGIRGYQDTLYAYSNRQFYRECEISGTVDFIFGDAIAVFQNCDIRPRQALPGQSNTITAQGCQSPKIITGFSFHLCNISGDVEARWSAILSPTIIRALSSASLSDYRRFWLPKDPISLALTLWFSFSMKALGVLKILNSTCFLATKRWRFEVFGFWLHYVLVLLLGDLRNKDLEKLFSQTQTTDHTKWVGAFHKNHPHLIKVKETDDDFAIVLELSEDDPHFDKKKKLLQNKGFNPKE